MYLLILCLFYLKVLLNLNQIKTQTKKEPLGQKNEDSNWKKNIKKT